MKKWQSSRFRTVWFHIVLSVSLLGCHIPVTWASSQIVEQDPIDVAKDKPSFLLIPYAFSSETFETAAGLAYFKSGGLGQVQFSSAGTALGSSNGSFLFTWMANKYQVPGIPRLFLDGYILGARYGALRIYAGKNPAYPDERAGSNDSSASNFFQEQAYEGIADVTLRYLMPLGVARDEVVHTYWLRDGLLVDGATDTELWNPVSGGRTYFNVHPRYQHQFVSVDEQDIHLKTFNVEFALEYDNRDFYLNPSRGSYTKAAYTHDWGVLNDSESWSLLEFDYTKYFSLTDLLPFRQTVCAFNFWTADTPSWDEETSADGKTSVSHRPPYFASARLGTLYRMRGYPSSRFNDKSAIYYGTELRVIPHWNPFPKIPVIHYLDVKWWQWATLFEVGRVAGSWNLSELHTDMKWDAGFSLRAMIDESIGRIDFVYSPESFGITVMTGHPF